MLTAIQRFRVEWGHCDPAGIIFNPNYYIWMDSGTHALLQAAGYDLIGNTHNDDLFRGCPLVASNMEFKRPLYFGDVTLLTSRVEKFGNTSFVVVHEFTHGDDPKPVLAAAKSGCGDTRTRHSRTRWLHARRRTGPGNCYPSKKSSTLAFKPAMHLYRQCTYNNPRKNPWR